MEEPEFRSLMKTTLDRIDAALADVDPDLAECSVQFGALTIGFADRTKCIISAQPSVRQLWLALAAKGVALHFNYDFARSAWLDDKTGGIELLAYLETFLREKTALPIRLTA